MSEPRPPLPPPAELIEFAFALDDFQTAAIDALRAGRSVLVAAPTSSGKTVVAEYAAAEARHLDERVFYTAPIKALSNQKFRDFAARYGPDQVGLLTGDNSVNPEAPIVVMTTEVLRNMIYAGSPALRRLRYVVLDEVHYLQDAYRGAVWEEVIVHLPVTTRLVCLSATVSNANELGEWIETVRGPTDVVIETRRPVELENLFMAADRTSERLHLIPTLMNGGANPEGQRFDVELRPTRRDRGRPRRPFATPLRTDVIEELLEHELLPAIYFIFSRQACDDAVRICLAAHLRLTNPAEREQIRAIVDDRLAPLSDSDLDALDYDSWLEGLERGFAAHHAGHIPPFKETVEVLFTSGLVKVVFATETLALGINMPARTVVIEKLTKFSGEGHEFLTAADYTQLTGRAGRRGIDARGHAVVLWSPFVRFQQVADLASSRSFTLRSSFRPTYNMAANLVRRYDAATARTLLNRSFGQFQTDRDLVMLESRLVKRRGEIERAHQILAGGDPSELPAPEENEDLSSSLSRLRPGEVINLPHGGPKAAVLSVAERKGGALRVRLITATDTTTTLTVSDIDEPLEVIGEVSLPIPFAPNNRAFQHEVALLVRRLRPNGTSSRRAATARARSRRPSDRARQHKRAADFVARAEREIAEIERRIATSTDSLARRFDEVAALLERWGYLAGWSLTKKGDCLVDLFHESDLLVAEALFAGAFDGLDVSSMAGLASTFVYEHRSPNPPSAPWFPNRAVHERYERLARLGEQLNRDEAASRLALTRPPDPTFFALAHAWAAGESLETVLADEDVSGGDFVRTTKLLIDLLGQMATAAPSRVTAGTAAAAAGALRRGVVALSGALGEE